jgi:DHA2 family multidrug resistance protein-like MFS transporter
LAGGAVFTIAALGSALAPSFGFLLVMRALGGLASAAMIVTTSTLSRALFPPAQLGRAIAVNAMFIAFGTAAGPTLGGMILSVAGWPWIFGISVPVGLAAVLLGARVLPHIAPTGGPLDVPSAILSAVGLGGAIYALDGIARHEHPVMTLTIAGTSLAILAFFVVRQLRVPHPLLAVELFADRVFTVAVIASAATYAAQALAYVALPFYLVSVLGHPPLAAGLLLSAWPLTTLIVAWRMGHLADRYSAAMLCTIGITVMGTGLALFALLPQAPPAWAIVLCAAVAGAGFGTFQTPNNRAMIASAPPEKTGRASGVMAITRLSGQTAGAALVAIIFSLAAASAPAQLGRGAIQLALYAACGLMAFAALMSALRMRTRALVARAEATTP